MTNRVAWAAIALWILTIAAAGLLFVRGSTVPAQDGRTSILLSVGDRDFVFDEMRSLLVAIRDISDGLNRNDTAEVVKAARGVGMAAAHDAAPTLMARLPLDFKRIAMPLHAGFDDLAAAAEHGESSAALAGRLIEQLDVAGCDDPRFFGGAKWRRGGDQGARDGPLVGSMVFDQKGRSSSSMWMRLLGLA